CPPAATRAGSLSPFLPVTGSFSARSYPMNAPHVVPQSSRTPSANFLDTLAQHFGARFSTAQAVREHHGSDESPFPAMLPDAVVFAQSTEEVAWLAQQCHAHRVPLIPYGAGSSLEGHILAAQGGISVDLSGMNQ